MPSFEWKGRDRDGNPQTGVLIGDSKEAVIAALRRQQIVVTTVKEKGKEIALPKFGGGIKQKDIAIFTRQFSVMIDAGLPLVQCLDILGQQQENKAFQKIILQVRQDVEAGSSLAEAMRKHPQAFNDLYVNMVAAGEAGGILDTILQRLADLHREGGQAQVPGPLGPDLPGRGHHDRDHRGLHHPVEGDPGLRHPVRGPRRPAAVPDPGHRQHLALHRPLLVADLPGGRSARSSRSGSTTRPRPAAIRSTS